MAIDVDDRFPDAKAGNCSDLVIANHTRAGSGSCWFQATASSFVPSSPIEALQRLCERKADHSSMCLWGSHPFPKQVQTAAFQV
jgi:hypothetical protein